MSARPNPRKPNVTATMTLPQYSNFDDAIRGTCRLWCDAKGYSDPFCQDGEWWAFPPSGVMPIRIKTVMGATSCCLVRINQVTTSLFPDGSLARKWIF